MGGEEEGEGKLAGEGEEEDEEEPQANGGKNWPGVQANFLYVILTWNPGKFLWSPGVILSV